MNKLVEVVKANKGLVIKGALAVGTLVAAVAVAMVLKAKGQDDESVEVETSTEELIEDPRH